MIMFIELTDIEKYYDDGAAKSNHVLRSVNMRVEKGEFVAVKGPSGSGKTTLLSILGALLQPDKGRYLLNGLDITEASTELPQIRNREIGFVFQDHRLLPQFTALENILLPALASNSKADKEQMDYARKLLAITDIAHVAEQYPPTLSGGEASRVAICRALLMKPSLLLADEPTGQLDSENASKIASLLSEINRSLGTTIIMVTHSEEAVATAHRILTLKDGVLQ
ncbi:MAG: ABC transporter ATP-binding protein [Tannerella sp.]|jgi:ABC-type lipoprotein export system ATPase subunit|nr:ABC transporter ATP-binding protein [Tannerella sp.]